MKMTIILLVLLGIVAGVCAVVLVGAIKSEGLFSRKSEEVAVVQAARGLPKGTRLAAEDLKIATVLPHEVPSGKYITNLPLVVGRTLSKEMKEDEFLKSDCLETVGTIQDLVSKLDDGERAVSVTLSNNQVTGGLLYPGCFVDVLASFKLIRSSQNKDSKGEAVSTTLLERIEVLAIQGQLADMTEEEKGASQTSRAPRTVTVTLRLNTKQAEAIQLAATNGEISVTMRNPKDNMGIDPNPTVLNRGKLTRRGMLIDPIVKGQSSGELQPGGGNLAPEPSSAWEVKVYRGSKLEELELKAKE